MSNPSNTGDVLSSMFNALNSGKDKEEVLETAGITAPEPSEISAEAVYDDEIADSAESQDTSIETILGQKFGESPESTSEEEASNESSPSQQLEDAPAADGKAGLPSVETVTVTDSKGRKKSVKVDFNDREQLKKFVHMASGMRKFQAERDALKKQISGLGDVEQVSEKVQLFNELDTIYQKDGSEGLINRLAGDGQAYETMRQKIIEEYEMRRSASPSELARMDYEKERSRQSKELEQIRMENEQFKASVQQKEEQAVLSALQSTVNTAFDKYRFNGKLDDQDQEYKLDKAVWSTAQAELAELESQGVELTNRIIEKTFRETAVPFRKYINKQSRAKLKKAITRKKQESASNVQDKIKNSMNSSDSVDQSKLAQEFKQGRGTSALLDIWARAQNKKRR